MKNQVLEGVKIADFCWAIAGPMTTKYLADYGATVVKIESTTRPDPQRTVAPFKDNIPGLNRTGGYSLYNRGKYSITINLGHPRGIEVAKRLVAWADVAIENFAPGMMARWGLDYSELRKIKPDIIMVSSSNLGQTGPHSKQAGLGFHLVALTGFSHLGGWPDSEPVGPYGAYTDLTAPALTAAAIIAALDYRRRTGKGQYLDLSQLEAGLHFLAPALLDYTANKREQSRVGNRCDYAVPHGAYRCKGEDRWCVIAVFTDEEWESFCKVIGSPQWAKESRFSTFLNRKRNEDELDRLVDKWTSNYTAEEVMSMMQEAGVAAGIVQNGEDLFIDPQLKHRHHFWELEHPEIGAHKVSGISSKLSKTPGRLGKPALIGEHNDYVCTQLLGMSDEEFAMLVADGVLA